MRKKRAGLGFLFVTAWTICAVAPAAGEAFIVSDGRAQAEIVIAENPPRMVNWAVQDLQEYVEKISGARLPVVTGPGAESPVKIYVGRSAHTDRLGISDEGLAYGAFRLVSGENWLALLGQDADYQPRPPYTMEPVGPDIARMLAEWDKLSGGFYGNPSGNHNRVYNRRLKIHAGDRRGSLNAVHEFLRRLGVRWYMPGALGEVVPAQADIPLPAVDETVRPAFAHRWMTFATYFSSPEDEIRWYLRQGLNHGYETGTLRSHGLGDVLSRPEMRAAHPEYYALAGGRRLTESNHACLSAPGLVEEAARYARAQFEVYDAPTVAVMPADGFTFCQCDLCRGKDTPERGRVGTHSDYVWGFVERVAREVFKTHPDRTLNCAAYGTYTLPPEKIEKLSPNVQVQIVHARGWQFPAPTERGLELPLPELRRAWRAKTDQPLISYEHYPFTHRGTFLPVYFLRAIDAGIKAQRDNSLGEFVEVAPGPFEVRGHGLHSPAFNHLNVYVTARLYWDPGLDLDALLDEYFRLFYGPAGAPVRALVEYSEANWRSMLGEPETIDRVFELLATARAAAPPDTAYRARVEGLADYLEALRQYRAQRARPREGVPEARGRSLRAAQVTLDGRLDEPAWIERLGEYRGFGLRAPDGGAPGTRAAFDFFWLGEPVRGTFYLGIICEEPDTANLAVAGAGNGDPAILDGDAVEILLETQGHSYYHLAVNPAGALVEFDRQGGKVNLDWTSRAEVAAHIGDGFWSVEMRIPVTGQDKLGDPRHEIAGRRPTADFPWFVNVGRQRVRAGAVERFAWSPAGGDSIHEPMKFGKFFVR